jgi:hypothetical protein
MKDFVLHHAVHTKILLCTTLYTHSAINKTSLYFSSKASPVVSINAWLPRENI